MNAITPTMLEELRQSVLEAGEDEDVGVVVLTGKGEAFSAGVDLKSLGDRALTRGKVGDILDLPARALIEAIQKIPKVVIALVNGYCFTGALEIALACDLVIASEEARIGDTHAKWGLRPTWGMSARLPRRVGLLKAKELSFTAEVVSGKEAERMGLVNMAAPAEKLEEALQRTARKILANSAGSVAAYKHLYNANENMSLGKQLELEYASEFDILDTEDRIARFRK